MCVGVETQARTEVETAQLLTDLCLKRRLQKNEQGKKRGFFLLSTEMTLWGSRLMCGSQ